MDTSIMNTCLTDICAMDACVIDGHLCGSYGLNGQIVQKTKSHYRSRAMRIPRLLVAYEIEF